MNTRSFQTTVFFLVFALVCTSCSNGDFNFFSGIDGQGQSATQELNLDNFNGIHLSISADVYVSQGSPQSVSIDAQQNIIDLLKTDVDQGIWKISTKDPVRNHKPIKITITVPELSYAKISGSGDIVGQTTFTEADEFETSIAGSGNIQLSVSTEELSAAISGSGDIELSGSAEELSIRISGSGDIDAEELEAEEAEVRVSGSGDCRVHATDELDVRVSGSGDVYYRGNPSVHSRISGSGDLEAI